MDKFRSQGYQRGRGGLLDRVSTGSGSDLVSDRHAIFAKDLDSDGWTRSLPLPVLTRSKCGVVEKSGEIV